MIAHGGGSGWPVSRGDHICRFDSANQSHAVINQRQRVRARDPAEQVNELQSYILALDQGTADPTVLQNIALFCISHPAADLASPISSSLSMSPSPSLFLSTLNPVTSSNPSLWTENKNFDRLFAALKQFLDPDRVGVQREFWVRVLIRFLSDRAAIGIRFDRSVGDTRTSATAHRRARSGCFCHPSASEILQQATGTPTSHRSTPISVVSSISGADHGVCEYDPGRYHRPPRPGLWFDYPACEPSRISAGRPADIVVGRDESKHICVRTDRAWKVHITSPGRNPRGRASSPQEPPHLCASSFPLYLHSSLSLSKVTLING